MNAPTDKGNAQAVRSRIRAVNRRLERCLHPDAPGPCGRIVDAHSIQRQGPLAHLKDDTNHVYHFSPFGGRGPRDPDRIGWNQASTFRGLCDRHDQIFGPIERVPFSSSPEQAFLVGYRATYLEIHEKESAAATWDRLGVDYVVSMYDPELQEDARRAFEVIQAGRRRGLVEIGQMKALYDRVWRASSFGELGSCIISFDGALDIASAGVVSPDFLVTGERLQELHVPDMQCLAFGTVVTDRGGAIVFTWPRGMPRMEQFVRGLTDLPRNDLPSALVIFMFSYVSNTFFRPGWWDGLRPGAQTRLATAATTPIQYYTPVNYRIGRTVDWTVTGIEFRG